MPALRSLHYRTLVKIFEQDGFAFNRQRGDHLIYTKAGLKRPLVIRIPASPRVHHQESPPHGRNGPRTLLRPRRKILSKRCGPVGRKTRPPTRQPHRNEKTVRFSVIPRLSLGTLSGSRRSLVGKKSARKPGYGDAIRHRERDGERRAIYSLKDSPASPGFIR
jgi:predicted RNA binding protein YcfA (HicA-like mRNA interferase family)